jgi:uncharacterized protein YciI
MRHFAVVREPGPSWDPTKPMTEQRHWAEHASFVNERAEQGVIVLGGPIGGANRFLLIMSADDEQEIRSGLDDDPWTPISMLTITSIEPWVVTTGGERVLEFFREHPAADLVATQRAGRPTEGLVKETRRPGAR